MIYTPLPTSRLVGFIELLANFQGECGDATLIGALRLLGEQRLGGPALESEYGALDHVLGEQRSAAGEGYSRQLHCDPAQLLSELEREYRELSQLAVRLALR